MDTELMLDVGQANEFKLACRRAGYTNSDVQRLTEGNMLTRLLPIVRGQTPLNQLAHVIDCDAEPFVPESWLVEEHQRGGRLIWDPSALTFHLSPQQTGQKFIPGNKLREELAQVPVQNACLLDYLLEHPNLIPDDWKQDDQSSTRYIIFWGTIYRQGSGGLSVCYVRCLCFSAGHWDWGIRWLDGGFSSRDAALVRAS